MIGPQPRTPLQRVLDGLLLPEVSVWSYREQFDNMWDDLANGKIQGRHVVIWSWTPHGDGGQVDTAPFLSPLHWAVCAARRCVSAGEKLRVCVLDLNPTHHQGSVDLYKVVSTLNASKVPWLRVFQAADVLDDARGNTVAERLDLSNEPVRPAGDALNLLVDSIRMGLSDPQNPDNRHSIANLVGPLLLLGHEPSRVPTGGTPSTQARHVNALKTLLETVGLLPTRDATSSALGKEPAQKPGAGTPVLSLPSGTRVFLLDDQWQQGWGEWVCGQLGATFTAPAIIETGWTLISNLADVTTVFAVSDPAHLLESPPELSTGERAPLKLAAGEKDRRFRLGFKDGDSTRDILLLDLRLFAGDDQKERAWTKEVVKECGHFIGQEHAWPGFDQDRLKQIEAWCKATPGDQPDSRATEARGLLGRLIALTDLSLPIILFSSTADSELVEQFKHYDNIITSFHKPRTFGSSTGEGPEEYRRLFIEALQQAAVLLEARAFVRRVEDWAREGHKRAWELAGLDPNGGEPVPWRYAEIYVDESGNPVRRAGGYIVLYSNDTDAPNSLAVEFISPWGFSREQALSRSIRENRIIPTDIKKKASSISYKKDSELGTRAEALRKSVLKQARLAACVINGSPQAEADGLGADVRYRAMISAIVEFFLYDWLPALDIAWNQPLTCGVFLATRNFPGEDVADLIRQHWDFGMPLQIHDAKGTEEDPGNVSFDKTASVTPRIDRGYTSHGAIRPDSPWTHTLYGRTMAPGDAFGLVLGIARERGAIERVRRAVSVTLSEYGKKSERSVPWPPMLPRQVHYASDDLLHKPELASQELRWGFRATLSPTLTTYFHGSRALNSSVAEGLAHLRDASAENDVAVSELLPWVSIRVEPLLRRMKGSHFIQFATSNTSHASLLREAARRAAKTQPTATNQSYVRKDHRPSAKPRQARAPSLQASRPFGGGRGSAEQHHVTATDLEVRISDIVDLVTSLGSPSAQAPQVAKAGGAVSKRRPHTSADLEATMRECLAAAEVDTIQIVKVAVSDSFSVVAVRSTDPAIDGARVCRINLLDQRVNKALGIPPPKFVTWTEDRVRLVKDILGKGLLGAAVSFDDGAIEIASKVGSPISDMRIRVVEEVIGCKVHVRATP